MATTTEDNNDNDVAVGSLPATFSDRLFDGLGLNPAFPLANGAATKTVGTLSGGSTLVGFVADLGGALPVYAGSNTRIAAENSIPSVMSSSR